MIIVNLSLLIEERLLDTLNRFFYLESIRYSVTGAMNFQMVIIVMMRTIMIEPLLFSWWIDRNHHKMSLYFGLCIRYMHGIQKRKVHNKGRDLRFAGAGNYDKNLSKMLRMITCVFRIRGLIIIVLTV